jgi:hypothetical protein
MSRACKSITVLVWLACCCGSFAEDEVSAPACADDVCVINVFATKLVVAPCAGYSVLAAYSKSNGATLIQCSRLAAGEENKSFVYDRQDREVKSFEFDGGRFIRPDYLATAEEKGIPDKFGPVPLCAAKNREAAAAGELLIAEKQPSNSEDDSYCYRIHYVVAEKGSLSIRSDNGKELSPLSEKATIEWTQLRERLSPYLDREQAAVAPKEDRTVTSDKAPLFSAPDLAATSRMYLVKGDKVEVVDDSKSANGWCRVRYVTKTGKTIEKWVQERDLDTPQK